MTLYGKPTGCEDDRLMSQSTILLGSASQVPLQSQREGNEELKAKGRKGGTGLG